MNLDLFISKKNRVCLVSDRHFDGDLKEVRFVPDSYELSLVLDQDGEEQVVELNVPVDFSIVPYLMDTDTVLVGYIEKDRITDADYVPLAIVKKG